MRLSGLLENPTSSPRSIRKKPLMALPITRSLQRIRTPIRAGIFLAVASIAFSFAILPAWGLERAPGGVEEVEAGPLIGSGSDSVWVIVSATSTAAPATPELGLIDFAHRGNARLMEAVVSANPIEGVSPEAPLWDGRTFARADGNPVPAFWTAPSPATYTLRFKQPIDLRFVDLAPPSRKHGFADFTVRVRSGTDEELHDVRIQAATVAAGSTLEAGFHWRLAITPEWANEVSIEFHRGSLYLSRQIFLHDLDLWGKE